MVMNPWDRLPPKKTTNETNPSAKSLITNFVHPVPNLTTQPSANLKIASQTSDSANIAVTLLAAGTEWFQKKNGSSKSLV